MSKVFCLYFVCDLTKVDCQPSEPVSTRSTACLHGAQHVYISPSLSTWRPARLHGAQHVYMAPNMSRSVPGASKSVPGASRSGQDIRERPGVQERPGSVQERPGRPPGASRNVPERPGNVHVSGEGRSYAQDNGQRGWSWALCGPELSFCVPCATNAAVLSVARVPVLGPMRVSMAVLRAQP